MTKYELISKRMAYILRWRPSSIWVKLNSEGYVDVDKFISGYNKLNKANITLEDLKHVVKTDDKTRYSFSEDGTMIRANQGHSKELNVCISMDVKVPPKVLFHGTSSDRISSIKRDGLRPMSRKYVHLTENLDTAIVVGNRYVKPNTEARVIVLHIDTEAMIKDGYVFKISENNVWQVESSIPAKYFKAR